MQVDDELSGEDQDDTANRIQADEEKAFASLGFDPIMTSNPVEASAMAEAVMDSDVTFSYAGEPSNKVKMMQVRAVFDKQDANLHTFCSIDEVIETGSAAHFQAVGFLSDLRCQYIRKLLEAKIVEPEIGWLMYTSNRIWHVRMREQCALHVRAMEMHEDENHVEH